LYLSYVIELLPPTKNKEFILLNNIQSVQQNREEIAKQLSQGANNLSTKDFRHTELPSAVINQNIREVKALFKTFIKSNSQKQYPEFKPNQPICYNNQNFKINIENDVIEIPLFIGGKTKRFAFPFKRTERSEELKLFIYDNYKLCKASLFYKNNKWYVAVTVSTGSDKPTGNNVMGIDIGIKQLAVASIKDEDGNEINRQFYNGREAGFMRKKYRTTRRKLGQNKKLYAIKKINNKESRRMTDKNHKISRWLVNLAVQEGVGNIVVEKLAGIRQKVKSMKRADRSIHNWTFHQLQTFIEYKAELEGIKVVYIDPSYTSQKCHRCGHIKKSNRRGNIYHCKECNYEIHADLNAARNIAQSA